MPTEMKLWRIEEDTPKPIDQDKLDLESRLENWMRDDIGLMNDDLLVIGQQVPTDHTGDIDLLAMDSEANLVILELKKDKTPRDIVAQILDYASYVQKMGISEIGETVSAAGFLDGKSLEEAFREKFGFDLPEFVNQAHRMYIVASSLDSATERIVEYLSETYGVDINVATFAYFDVGGQEMIGRSMLLDEEAVQTRSETRAAPKRRRYLTQAELRDIAEESGVEGLWDKAIKGFWPLSQSRGRSQSTLFFNVRLNGSSGAFISLRPMESSAKDGLVITVNFGYIAERFDLSRDQIEQVSGPLINENPKWSTATYFFEDEQLGRLIELLKQNAPQS